MRVDFQRLTRDQGGFAMAIAVFALVLLAAVVAGGYFAASQEFQIGRGMRSLTKSFYAGEAGIHEVLEDWDTGVYGALQPGDSVTVGPLTVAGGAIYTANIVRVGRAADSAKRFFYIEAAGRPPAPTMGERRQAVVVRSRFADLCCLSAISVVNNVTFTGGAQYLISGFSTDPPGNVPAGACLNYPTDSVPGVRHGPSGVVNDPDLVVGAPSAIVNDGSLGSGTIFSASELTYDELVAMADHEFVGSYTLNDTQPALVNGKCDKSQPDNWGSPEDSSSPCFNYFPIIHVTEDLNLIGAGVAQGILLIDGDLFMNGPFRFYGIAFIKDDLHLDGTVDFYGGAYVADDVWFNGATPRFWYSRCAIERAERFSKITQPRLVSPRAWVELF